jgi:hypothetical protein
MDTAPKAPDITALQHGDDTAHSAAPQPQSLATPFAAAPTSREPSRDAWSKARSAVMHNIGLSAAFKTLRDMKSSDFIKPEQLKTLQALGAGAFATVEKAM